MASTQTSRPQSKKGDTPSPYPVVKIIISQTVSFKRSLSKNKLSYVGTKVTTPTQKPEEKKKILSDREKRAIKTLLLPQTNSNSLRIF